jgi:hypothetical protein
MIETMEETKIDNEMYEKLFLKIEEFVTDESFKSAILLGLKNAESNIKVKTGQARIHVEALFIEKLYTDKNRYCLEHNVVDIPEISDVIREINHYLMSMIEELEIKEALLKQGIKQ